MEQLLLTFHVILVKNVWEQWNICNWFTVFSDRMFRTWKFPFSSLILVSGFSGCFSVKGTDLCKCYINRILELKFTSPEYFTPFAHVNSKQPSYPLI